MMPDTTVYVAYGLTEVAGRLRIFPSKKENPYLKSIGKPISEMNIIIRDDNTLPLPPGNLGNIYVTGPCLFLGYYKKTQQMANLALKQEIWVILLKVDNYF